MNKENFKYDVGGWKAYVFFAITLYGLYSIIRDIVEGVTMEAVNSSENLSFEVDGWGSAGILFVFLYGCVKLTESIVESIKRIIKISK